MMLANHSIYKLLISILIPLILLVGCKANDINSTKTNTQKAKPKSIEKTQSNKVRHNLKYVKKSSLCKLSYKHDNLTCVEVKLGSIKTIPASDTKLDCVQDGIIFIRGQKLASKAQIKKWEALCGEELLDLTQNTSTNRQPSSKVGSLFNDAKDSREETINSVDKIISEMSCDDESGNSVAGGLGDGLLEVFWEYVKSKVSGDDGKGGDADAEGGDADAEGGDADAEGGDADAEGGDADANNNVNINVNNGNNSNSNGEAALLDVRYKIWKEKLRHLKDIADESGGLRDANNYKDALNNEPKNPDNPDGTSCESIKASWEMFKNYCDLSDWQSYQCSAFLTVADSCLENNVDPSQIRPNPNGTPNTCDQDAVALAIKNSCESQGGIMESVAVGSPRCNLSSDNVTIPELDICSDPRIQFGEDSEICNDNLGVPLPEREQPPMPNNPNNPKNKTDTLN